jgi:hypothetical protein
MFGRMFVSALLAATVFSAIFATPATTQKAANSDPAHMDKGYVGSSACGKCHRQIYTSYSQTDMGRSMSVPSRSLIKTIASPIAVHDARSNHEFEIFIRDNQLFQSEFGVGTDGKEIFRDTHQIEWIIGAGANGFGTIVKRDDYLFEAPLSFYAKPAAWALSPGYEFVDYGFSRPILPGCIACHSGRAEAVPDGNGRFRNPPFAQLAIGCENCHGPGQTHVSEMLLSEPSIGSSATIVNPAKLSPGLADNICMSCHQMGDARVLQPDKDYRDFRPGTLLKDTLAILMVPPSRGNPLESDLLEHYFSMTLSKCYRTSRGRMGCITCHDPHVEPSASEAPAYFRGRCLSCHSEKSCAVPITLRQRKNPPDDCAGCHMPKRDVRIISHSALTNHRIIAESGEVFPEVLPTPQTPGLMYLNSVPGQDISVSPLVLLQAYGQVMASHPEYREKYWNLARQLKSVQPDNVAVLKALADWSTQQKSADAVGNAIEYLESAIEHGDTDPTDYEELARLLMANGRTREVVKLLQRGLQDLPYDAEYYRLLGKAYLDLSRASDAREILAKGAQIFPQDSGIRELLKQTETSRGPTRRNEEVTSPRSQLYRCPQLLQLAVGPARIP